MNKSSSLYLSLAPTKMVSLSNQTRFSLHPNNLFVSENRRLGISGVNFPRKIKVKITCFAAERSRQEKQKRKSQSQSTSDAEAGVDPVGFLTRLGIADRIFAQFLRERYNKSFNFEQKVGNKEFNF